ncbi:hypothetical protein TYRP_021197 [Tyrophagus putrescentiae]|nr:hypothetical protein TYRP_021197 [Tyrophagus putrescentiae]
MKFCKAVLALCALATLAIVSFSIELPSMQTNWQSCSNELKSPALSDDLEVYCPTCPAVNGTETKCHLKKGTPVTIIIRFRPRVNVSNLERVIIARVPAPLGKKVEMPYGPPLNPCPNVTSAEPGEGTGSAGCTEDGTLLAGHWYTYASTFDVLQSFPAVEDLETRHLLRVKHEKHRKLRLYKKHPGPTVYCIMVPNIYVSE